MTSSTKLVAFNSDETVVFITQEHQYSTYLYEVEKNDEARIMISRESTESTNIDFSYVIYAKSEIISSTGGSISLNETHRLTINGSINPGQKLAITHKITECQIDIIPAVIFKFNKSDDLKASINVAIEIITKNNHNCGGQLSGPEFGFPLYLGVIVLIFLVIFILFIRRSNRSYKDILQEKE